MHMPLKRLCGNMKKTNHNITEPVDKQRYKKSYLKRVLEEQEAKKIIKEFKNTKEQKEDFHER